MVRKVLNEIKFIIWERNKVGNIEFGMMIFNIVLDKRTNGFLEIRTESVLKCTTCGTIWNCLNR